VDGQRHIPGFLFLGRRANAISTGGRVGLRASLGGSGKSHPNWGLILDCPARREFLFLLHHPFPCFDVVTSHYAFFPNLMLFPLS